MVITKNEVIQTIRKLWHDLFNEGMPAVMEKSLEWDLAEAESTSRPLHEICDEWLAAINL